jgi:hypothetical protein
VHADDLADDEVAVGLAAADVAQIDGVRDLALERARRGRHARRRHQA